MLLSHSLKMSPRALRCGILHRVGTMSTQMGQPSLVHNRSRRDLLSGIGKYVSQDNIEKIIQFRVSPTPPHQDSFLLL